MFGIYTLAIGIMLFALAMRLRKAVSALCLYRLMMRRSLCNPGMILSKNQCLE
jgi:hypothetical protein